MSVAPLQTRSLAPSKTISQTPDGHTEMRARSRQLGELRSLPTPTHELPARQRRWSKLRYLIPLKERSSPSAESQTERCATPTSQQSVACSNNTTTGRDATQSGSRAPSMNKPDISAKETRHRNISIQQELDSSNGLGIADHQMSTLEKPYKHTHSAKEVKRIMMIAEDINIIEIQHVDEFREPFESHYRRAETAIFDFLDQPDSPLPFGKLKLLRGAVLQAGASVSDTTKFTPCIRIAHGDFGHNQKIIKFHLKFSSQRKLYDPRFNICYQTMKDLSAVGRTVTIKTQPTESMCGVLASTGSGLNSHEFTIGGLLEVDGEIQALTAWHSEALGDLGSASETVEELVKRLLQDNGSLTDLERPNVVARYRGQSKFEEDVRTSKSKEPQPDSVSSIGQILRSGPEWALISVSAPSMRLPNCMEVGIDNESSGEAIKGFLDISPHRHMKYFSAVEPAEESDAEPLVYVIAGMSGIIQAKVSRKLSPMRLDSGQRVRVWTLKLGVFEGHHLRPGDSGSWVVDFESGAVYGHVIAGTHENAFVLPLQDIMTEIGNCRLPSPFQRLAELAKAHRDIDPNKAVIFARKAMSDEVLRSSVAELNSLARLIERRQDPTFEPDRPYSDLDPTVILREIIMRWGASLPDASHLVDWLMSDKNLNWYFTHLTPDEIRDMLQELGIHTSVKRTTTRVQGSGSAASELESQSTTHPFYHYSRIEISQRQKYLNLLKTEKKLEVLQESDRVESIRQMILRSERHLRHDTPSALRGWLDLRRSASNSADADGSDIDGSVSQFTSLSGTTFKGKGLSSRNSMITGPRTALTAPILRFDFQVRNLQFRQDSGRRSEYSEFPCGNWEAISRGKWTTHVHLPANNLKAITKHLDAYRRNEAHAWQSLQTGPLNARRMRTTCAQVLSHTSIPDIILSMPYIDWDRTSRVKQASSWMARRIEGLNCTTRPKPTFTGSQWKLGDILTIPQSAIKRSYGTHRQTASEERPLLPATLLGQSLLDAARLYEKMALLADEQLVQQHLLGNEPLHPRLELSQACAGAFSVHHQESTTIKGMSYARPEAIMVDQVWLRIVDMRTVITACPQRYGREASDPHSLYRRIRKRLENEAQDVEITTFNIAVVVLDECIGSFFQQTEVDGEAIPFGIASVNKRLQDMSSRTNTLRRRFKLHLAAGSREPAPMLHLELVDVQRQADELVKELSMISSIMAEQTKCIADFEKVSCSLPRWSRRDDEKSPHRLENKILRSRLESQCQEIKRLDCAARSIEKTISDIILHEQIRLLNEHAVGVQRNNSSAS
ncbi:hypothetical protein CI238_05755 [Colletotrichum incanum]|uniref:Uncharacterized protein n=1 Tax=Colletotrichum incanum TaxID=1573173 RepID=A0A162NEH8_COLIC|nr:hypothetical protein CI238_05755 [Colletotrichum incanum]